LTTHSIHEAESLCNRIGILIKGEFVCIDTPAELKRRYGKGYRISVRCENMEKIEIVKKQMKETYQNYETQEHPESLKIAFEIPKTNFKFSESFKLFYNKLYLNGIVK
jgi:ATP-binding cassette, subfamily A (ABC1), member 3